MRVLEAQIIVKNGFSPVNQSVNFLAEEGVVCSGSGLPLDPVFQD